MYRRLIIIFLLHLALLSSDVKPVYSQKNINIKASVNNLFRYGNGSENFSGILFHKEYFENLTDAKISINNLSIGLLFEVDEPAELSRNFKGISKRYIEYTNHDNFEVRAGTFYELISRGLTLNSFEQRQLAYDTGLDGIRIVYKSVLDRNKSFRIKSEMLGGYMEYSDYLNPERIEKYDIKDANVECQLFSVLNIGFNYVYAKGKIPSGNIETEIKTYLPETYFSLNSSNFQFFSSYAHKKTEVTANELYPVAFKSKGDGFYSSVNYSIPGLGFTFEYKNYRFDVTTPDNQSTERPTKTLPFQNPPTAVKQHTSVLTSRIPHAPDFNDDVGCQLDVIYLPDESLTLSFNASISSRHYNFYDADTSSLVKFSAVKRKLSFIPSLDESYSPYTELSIEAEKDFTKILFGKVGLYYQYGVTYNFFFNDTQDKKRYITIPAEARYNLTEKLSLKLHIESQWAHNSFREVKYRNFANHYASFSITRSPDFSFTINAEYTTDKLELSGKSNWLEAEASWNISTSNIITASFGSERGGLRCTSGVCRYINPFNGFRLTIQNKF